MSWYMGLCPSSVIGSESSQRLLFFSNQTFCECSLLWQSSQKYILGFWIFFLNMGPHGRENFKTLLLIQLWFFFNQTSECSLWQSSQKIPTGMLKFQISIFFKRDWNFHWHGALWEGKFQNVTSTVTILFEPNLFWTFPVTVFTIVAYRNFENSKIIFLKDWNLT